MTIKRRLLLSNILMILVPAAVTALIGTISIRLIWGILSASPEEVRHYGPRSHVHPGMLLSLFDGQKLFFGPGEAMTAIVVILIITVILSILVTNRFLTRFVFRHIREPLDSLSAGTCEIGRGNLEHRIVHQEQDEFAPVCRAFNDMALRLKASVDQSQKDEENRKLLLAGISHDLRSPLTSIRAYTEGLMDGIAETSEEHQKYLSIIHRKTEEIDHLVSQVFTYSKLDLAGPSTDTMFRPDMEIAAFLDEQAADYEAKGLVIRASLVPASVPGEGALFRRILANLSENSLKYRCAEPGHLTFTLQRAGDRYLFTASDDGPGVPDQALPRLFDVFYRTDKARQTPASGSGLGLAIVRRCVEQMAGKIWAEHAPGGGLTVRISLPMQMRGEEQ